MNSQPIHCSHELIQITRRGVNFQLRFHIGTSSMKPNLPDLLRFAATPSLQHLSIFMAPHGWVHSSGLFSGDRFSAVAGNLSRTQSRLSQSLERVFNPSAWLTRSCNSAWLWFLSVAPGVSKHYPGQMLLNLSVSNMAWSADLAKFFSHRRNASLSGCLLGKVSRGRYHRENTWIANFFAIYA